MKRGESWQPILKMGLGEERTTYLKHKIIEISRNKMFKEILTNPRNHNPCNFIYIVHAINDRYSEMGVNELHIREKIRQIRSENYYYCGSLVGKLCIETARRMFDKYKCNSPISQTDTNGPIGLILDIPDDDVIRIASTSDLNSPDKEKELRGFVIHYKGKKEQPLKLLCMSEGTEFGSREYNEMILKGHPATDISGVFYQDTDSKIETDGKFLGKMISQLGKKKFQLLH